MLRKLRSLPALPIVHSHAPNAVRRGLLVAASALALAVLCSTSDAHAQSVSGDFAVQRFDPAAGAHNYFTTRGARTDGKMVWSLGLYANYSYRPFEVKSCTVSQADQDAGKTCSDTGVARGVRTTRVIENEITGDVLGARTPLPPRPASTPPVSATRSSKPSSAPMVK